MNQIVPVNLLGCVDEKGYLGGCRKEGVLLAFRGKGEVSEAVVLSLKGVSFVGGIMAYLGALAAQSFLIRIPLNLFTTTGIPVIVGQFVHHSMVPKISLLLPVCSIAVKVAYNCC